MYSSGLAYAVWDLHGFKGRLLEVPSDAGCCPQLTSSSRLFFEKNKNISPFLRILTETFRSSIFLNRSEDWHCFYFVGNRFGSLTDPEL